MQSALLCPPWGPGLVKVIINNYGPEIFALTSILRQRLTPVTGALQCIRSRSRCLACSGSFAVFATNKYLCITGERDQKQKNAEVHEVVGDDARYVAEQART
jgi:hypothetical protein